MTIKNNTLRGKILEFLHDIFPNTADSTTILGALYPYHEAERIDQSIAYLADKGLIAAKELPHPYKAGERVILYKIAPNGIDIMDGNCQDPGVTVIRER